MQKTLKKLTTYQSNSVLVTPSRPVDFFVTTSQRHGCFFLTPAKAEAKAALSSICHLGSHFPGSVKDLGTYWILPIKECQFIVDVLLYSHFHIKADDQFRHYKQASYEESTRAKRLFSNNKRPLPC